MPRTVINLDLQDKIWLDHEARERHVPMTELVRRAVRSYRVREQSRIHPDLQDALKRTSGIWRGGEGLAWQRRRRDEWDRAH
jgi:hypothetical protein